MKDFSTGAKCIASLVAMSAVLWFGGSIVRYAIAFDVFLPGTLTLKPFLTPGEVNATIRLHAAAAGATLVRLNSDNVNVLAPATVLIPAGSFLMGSETGNNYRLWRTVPGGGRIEPVPGWPKELKAGSKPTVANGLLFFRGGDGLHKNELWKYDGERASLVKDINPGPAGSFPGYITGLGNQVIFNATDGVHGGELWRSDGTASGTRMIGEINPGAKGTNMAWLTRVGDSVYLTADTPGHWLEPWRTDGEQLGLVAAEHEGPEWDNITSFAGLGGKVYFTANNELWESDDAWPEAEVHPIADDPDFPTTAKNAPVAAGNRIFFASFAGDWTGTMQSWPSFYDGEKIVTLTDPEEEFDYPWGYPQFFKEFGGRVFFVGADTLHGTELRVVSGRHYRLFADILEGDSSSRPRGFARSKHFMYFVADDGIHGREIWRLRRTAG